VLKDHVVPFFGLLHLAIQPGSFEGAAGGIGDQRQGFDIAGRKAAVAE
jgi:hypothetical protein